MPTSTKRLSTALRVSAADDILTDAAAFRLTPPTMSYRMSRFVRDPWVQRIASVVFVLIIWQAFGSDFTTSTPGAIFTAATQTLGTEVLPAFGATLTTFGIGFGICIVAGVPIGLAMARIRPIRVILEPYVNTFYSLPMVSLFPVLLLAFGIGTGLRIAATVLFGIFAVIVNTFIGASSIDPAMEDTAKVFVASPWKRLTTVILPASLHYIFAGIRIAFGHGMIGAVVIEIEASAVGVGYLLGQYGHGLRLDKFFTVVFVLGIFSIVAGIIMRRTERHFTQPWLRPAWARPRSDVMPPAKGAVSVARPARAIPAPVTAVGHFFALIGRGISALVRRRWGAILVQIAVLLALLTFWQIGSLGISRAVLPSPIALGQAIVNQTAGDFSIWGPLWESVSLLVVGWVFASVLGAALGLAMGQFRWLSNVLDPYVQFLYALPHAVFIPVLVVWLGFGFSFGLGYVVISAIFPVMINAMQSVRSMKQEYPDLARSFNASP
ncbi:MAG TPA: ABC transporter permease subunit, partial [Pseudolysinimonas sp.]